MIHFLPDSADAAPAPYAEAVARLASIHQALRLVGQLGDGPYADSDTPRFEPEVAAAWPTTPPAAQRCFEARSARTASAAVAGLEAVIGRQSAGAPVNPAAVKRLEAHIRQGLADIESLLGK